MRRLFFLLLFSLGLAAVGFGNVAFDSSAGANASPVGSTQTWSHTIGNHPNRVLIVQFGINNATNWLSGAPTFDGISMTLIGIVYTAHDPSNAYYTGYQYELTAPPIGTYSVSLPWGAGVTDSCTSMSFYNCSGIVQNQVNENNASGAGTLTTGAFLTGDAIIGMQIAGTGSANGWTGSITENFTGTGNNYSGYFLCTTSGSSMSILNSSLTNGKIAMVATVRGGFQVTGGYGSGLLTGVGMLNLLNAPEWRPSRLRRSSQSTLCCLRCRLPRT